MVFHLMEVAETPVSVIEAAPWLHLTADYHLNKQSSILRVYFRFSAPKSNSFVSNWGKAGPPTKEYKCCAEKRRM